MKKIERKKYDEQELKDNNQKASGAVFFSNFIWIERDKD